MHEPGILATKRGTSEQGTLSLLNAGRWIITQPPGYLQKITLKDITPYTPGVTSFFYLASLHVPFVDC
jgi:hypothetical protein